MLLLLAVTEAVPFLQNECEAAAPLLICYCGGLCCSFETMGMRPLPLSLIYCCGRPCCRHSFIA